MATTSEAPRNRQLRISFSPMTRSILAPLLGLLPAQLAAQHFHRLPATPQTVAYGYYSAAATPVLRIASGDTIEVETLITNRPDRLEAAGVAPADVRSEEHTSELQS